MNNRQKRYFWISTLPCYAKYTMFTSVHDYLGNLVMIL